MAENGEKKTDPVAPVDMAIIMISKVNSDKLEPGRGSCRTPMTIVVHWWRSRMTRTATTTMMMIMMASLGLIFSASGEIGSLNFLLLLP